MVGTAVVGHARRARTDPAGRRRHVRHRRPAQGQARDGRAVDGPRPRARRADSGARPQYVYRLDLSPNEFYLVVAFENREAYHANAASPEQQARYAQVRALLEADPEWHDGEIVFAAPA